MPSSPAQSHLPMPLSLTSQSPHYASALLPKGLESMSPSSLLLSSPFPANSDRSWSGIHTPSPLSTISPPPGFASLTVPRTQSNQPAVKEGPIVMVDLTGDTPSPAKDQRWKRHPSLILLSSDEDQSPLPSSKHLDPAVWSPQAATRRGPKRCQGTQQGPARTFKTPDTIVISSDPESSDSTPSL